MDQSLDDKESLVARIQQLEHERDELRKDIEQLCIQQAGPSYLVVATKMHFQRTAGLEQEIENLKKKLAACTRDNENLQEELSEAYRIKGQLADLHSIEVAKNQEAEKQLKFFQSCVAAAFAERDQSIMEAEKAKEKEELMLEKLNDVQKRIEELTAKSVELEEQNATFRINLVKEEQQNEAFKEVVDKFYKIRQDSSDELEDTSWADKCLCLLLDPAETWSFNDTSTSMYISSLEEGLEKMKKSVDNLQNKLRVGLEIESHLKKQISALEKMQFRLNKTVMTKIEGLWQSHSQHRAQIVDLLRQEKSHMKLIIGKIKNQIDLFDGSTVHNSGLSQRRLKGDDYEFGDVHINTDDKRKVSGLPFSVPDSDGDASEALTQALQEKVATLLLLSQQEERHLLERNVNVALQKKTEELQRNLLQVTNEKVKALMELAQVKQEYQLLREKIGQEVKQGTDIVEKKLYAHERAGRLRSLLKKTYLKRWIGTPDFSGNEAAGSLNNEGNYSGRRSNSFDFARMKIENATMKETIDSLEHLTSAIHRLRLSLQNAKESFTSEDGVVSVREDLEDIINDAKLLKTALGSSLPISWSAEGDTGSLEDSSGSELGDAHGNLSNEKIDSVSAAGFEMVDLLIFAARLLKDDVIKSGS